MSNIFGGGGTNKQGVSTTGYGLSGEGLGAPWDWGVSQFDQSQIDNATKQNTTAMTDRYNQLGLGGSSAEATDLSGIAQQGQAITGQLQNQNVTSPQFNPALQPQLNSVIGGGSTSPLSSLAGQIAGTAGKAIGALGTGGSGG